MRIAEIQVLLKSENSSTSKDHSNRVHAGLRAGDRRGNFAKDSGSLFFKL